MIKIKNVINIISYLVTLAGTIPLYPYLGLLPKILFPLSLVAAIFFDRKGKYPLKGIFITLPMVLLFFWYGSTLTMADIATPFANLLVALLAVRLVAEKNNRNYLQIFTLSIFSLAVTSLFTLTGFFIFYLLLLLFLVAAALLLMTFSARDPNINLSPMELRKVIITSLLLPLLSFPLMVIFFVLLPRTQFPLWNVLKQQPTTAGFSEKVDPGRSAVVGAEKTVAFRVEMVEVAPEDLYWRVTVLNTLAGKSWVRDPKVTEKEFPLFIKGNEIQQVIYPEPGRGDYLVTLNIPRGVRALRSSQSGDHVFTSRWQAQKRSRYEAQSVIGSSIKVRNGIDRGKYLQLPQDVSGRILDLGKSFAVRGQSDEKTFAAVARFFETGGFSYSNQDLPVGKNAIDEFLFKSKKGNCEFFASSSALLLRAAGVPARLVGGYYGGEYNDLGGYYIVTEDRAHVWVEAYVQNKGWVTLDPSRFAINASGAFSSMSGQGLKRRVQMMMDMVTYYWNQSVINYDFERQLHFLQSADKKIFNFGLRRSLKYMAAITIVVALAMAAFFIKRGGWRKSSIQEKLTRKLLRKIAKKYPDMVVTRATGLYELAEATNDPVVIEFASIYGTALYGDRGLSDEDIAALKLLLRRI